MRKVLASALFAVVCLSTLLPIALRREVAAGTAVQLDLAGLVAGAEWVLEARVVGARVQVDARGRPETEYTLAVATEFLGTGAARRTFRMPGGVLPDGSGLVLPGVPRLDLGEDAIVFLTRESRAGLRMPVGLAQGKLRIVRDAVGQRVLVREHGDLDLVTREGRPVAIDRAAVQLDYDAARAEIERACAAKRARDASRVGR